MGIRYYKGEATVKATLWSDSSRTIRTIHNAIRIDNVRRQWMGHVSRDMAAILAPLMDFGELVIERALTGTEGEF